MNDVHAVLWQLSDLCLKIICQADSCQAELPTELLFWKILKEVKKMLLAAEESLIYLFFHVFDLMAWEIEDCGLKKRERSLSF